MRVLRQSLPPAESLAASVVTIGNFDGVHCAHQELFGSVVQAARSLGVPAVVLTFDPHPAQILAPERVPKTLTQLSLKLRLIAEQGVDIVWILPFTHALAQLSPEEFVEQALVRALGARQIHVGANFCFGRNRQGTVDRLRQLGETEGFAVHVLPLRMMRGEPVSSSRIRALLDEGKISLANRLLGRAYELAGLVEPGEGRGRRLTVPTLNLATPQQQLPRTGVYVTRTLLGERRFESVTNVGTKPTFGPHPLSIETYLLEDPPQGEENRLRIQFLYRLREERAFPTSEALKAQIGKDIRRTRRYFHWQQFFSTWMAARSVGKS